MTSRNYVSAIAIGVVTMSASAWAEDPYVEADGSQFVNLGYYVNPKSHVELDYALIETGDYLSYKGLRLLDNNPTKQGQKALSLMYYAQGNEAATMAFSFGDRADSGAVEGIWTSATDIRLAQGTPGGYCDAVRRRVVVDVPTKTTALYEGESVCWAYVHNRATTATSKYPLCLFGQPDNANATTRGTNGFKARIYGLKIAEDGVVLYDFKPVRKGDTVGLYDEQTGTFLYDTRPTNAGVLIASANLPEIEDEPYIQSTRASGVNTRFFTQPGMKIEIDYAFTDVSDPTPTESSHYQQRLFGQDTANPTVSVYINGNGVISIGSGDTFKAVVSGYNPDLKRHTMIVDYQTGKYSYKQGVTVWKEADLSSETTRNNTATRPIGLFGSVSSDAATSFKDCSKARIYRARFWNGEGMLKHDYVPYKKGDVYGFKDLVDGAFICDECRAAADQRLSGSANVPSEAADPSIISNGTSDQHIDTGYRVTDKTRVEVDFAQLTAKQFSGHNQGIFGSYGDQINMLLYSNAGDGMVYSFNVGTSTPDRRVGMDVYSALARRTAIFDAKNSQVIVRTGDFTNQVIKVTADISGRTNARTLPLLGYDNDGAYGALQPHARLYGCKIYEDDKLVSDFVPAIQDGRVGLRDRVTQRFVTTACATPLAADAVTEPAWPFIQANGTQGINTGYKMKSTSRAEIDFAYTEARPSNSAIIGAWGCTNNRSVGFINGSGFFAMTICGSSWATYYNDPATKADTKRHTAVLDAYHKIVRYQTNGADVYTKTFTYSDADHPAEHPLGIIAGVNDVAGTSFTQKSKAKVYAFRIYESDKLIHNYLPYTDGTVVGLKDAISGGVITSTVGDKLTISGYVEPKITVQPQGGAVPYPKSRKLSVTAPGATAYQWYKDGEPIDGATASTYVVDWTRKTPDAVYTVKATFVVYGDEVVIESDPAAVTMNPSGLITIFR